MVSSAFSTCSVGCYQLLAKLVFHGYNGSPVKWFIEQVDERSRGIGDGILSSQGHGDTADPQRCQHRADIEAGGNMKNGHAAGDDDEDAQGPADR